MQGNATRGVAGPQQELSRARERTASVSVVIPTLNEARNLERVLGTLPLRCELVIVDGHSTDGTVDLVHSMRPDAVIVTQQGHGKGEALLTGFSVAAGDILVTLDADGSADPDELPRFVDALLDGADFVKGSRNVEGGGSEDLTLLRTLGNRFLTTAFNWLYDRSYTDLCYGYNALWRHCLAYLPSTAAGFEIETMFHAAMALSPCHVVEVPSFERRRIHGSSNLRPFRDGIRILRSMLAARVTLDLDLGIPTRQFALQ
jgi:glycosyltransferase involved in cell wall biosynthesis